MGIERVVEFWETLTPESLDTLESVYTGDVLFRDPFNEVRGAAALTAVFRHMFETLEVPRFTIRDTVLQGDRAALTWDFDFRVKAWQPGVARRIHGLSLLRFAADGRVCEHRDYWDAAGELYARLPLLGPVMRWLARRFAAPPPR